MARAAIHFVIAIGKNSSAAWEAGIDQPHHGDHLACNFLLGIRVSREIALHMTIRALHSQRLFDALHDEGNIGVRREQFEVLRSGLRSCPAPARLLSEQRNR